MGKIDRIIINNFKSYKGEIAIGPFKTFTAVIGPNGVGKSNLMDAISFVLGVRTVQLRGVRLEDLIFRVEGETEKDLEGRYAFVEMVYKEENGEETSYRRTIHSSGKTEYHINKKIVNRNSYHKALSKIGVLVKSRNFLVFQGDVESVAQKTPQQLTELFEQISGSTDLKEEYEDAKEKQLAAEDELARVFEKKKNISKEKTQIKKQKEEAEQFQRYLEDQKKLKLEHFLLQLFRVDQEINANNEELKKEKESILNLKIKVENAENDLKLTINDRQKLHKQKMYTEKRMESGKKNINKKQKTSEKLGEEINHLETLITKTESEMEKIQKSYENQENKISETEKELKRVREEIIRFNSEKGIPEELQLNPQQLKKYTELKAKAAVKTTPLRQKLDDLIQSKNYEEEEYETLKAQIDTFEKRLEQQREYLSKHNQRQKRLESEVVNNKNKLSEENNRQIKLETQTRNADERKQSLEEQLQSFQIKLEGARADIRDNEKIKKIRDCIESLKLLYPDSVKGRLIDLISPTQRKYQQAISVVLGKNIDAIVTEDEKTSLECVRYLREKHVGVATFIPLDHIRTKPIIESLRQLGGTLKLVYDVIRFEPDIEKAVLYSCGNTLVCNTIDEAKTLCYGHSGRGGSNEDRRYRVVTLDGTIIDKTGNMTGGYLDERANRWDESEVLRIKDKRDQILKEITDLDSAIREVDDIKQLKTNVSQIDKRLEYAKSELKKTTEKIKVVSKDINLLEEDINTRKPSLKKIKISLNKINSEIKDMENKLHTEEDTIFHSFSDSIGVSNIREYQEKRIKASEEENKKTLALKTTESRLVSTLNYMNSKDIKTSLKSYSQKIQTQRDKLGKMIDEEEKLNKEVMKETTELETISTEVDEIEESIRKTQYAVDKGRKAIDELGKEITDVELAKNARETKYEQLGHLRHEVFQQCKVEQVELPLKSGYKRKASGDMKLTKKAKRRRGVNIEEDEEDSDIEEEISPSILSPTQDSSLSTATKEREDNESSNIDYTSLPEEYHDLSATEYEKTRKELVLKIEKITQDIEKMFPNMKAAEKFEEITERLKSTVDTFDNAKKASEESASVFNEIKNDRCKKFFTCFNHVARVIDPVYKRLTTSRNFPSGGSAYLFAENPEEPYIGGIRYNATPPTKRFRDIEQLSGGEKTVAALALLFSIHSFHPAPFFVMDEIDAALDSSNVNKVSQYIRSRAHDDGLQCVVISLKDMFYEKADALIGIFKDKETMCSGALTIDLEKYNIVGE